MFPSVFSCLLKAYAGLAVDPMISNCKLSKVFRPVFANLFNQYVISQYEFHFIIHIV